MRILQGLLTSLLIHILLVIFINKMPLPPPVPQEIVEFQIQSPSQNETLKRQIVRNALLPEKLKVTETQDQLRFLSDKVQRVKEQTKATLSGLTENRSAQRQRTHKKLDPFESGYHAKMNPSATNESGLSTISESIEQVKVGSMTALNTDQYLFYSFFNRVNELVYYPWSNMVRSAQDRVAQRLYNKTVHTRWLTQIEIWIKPNGEFHSAHIMKESGIPEFDRAAASAFKQAGFFPNPPPEMIEEDGLIHLKYGLTVYFDPKVLVYK